MSKGTFTTGNPLYFGNITFPMVWSGQGFARAVLEKRAEKALLHLFATKRGSLWGDPNYGTEIYTFRGQGMTFNRGRGDVSIAGSEAILDDAKAKARVYLPFLDVVDTRLESTPGSLRLAVNIFWMLNAALSVSVEPATPKKSTLLV